MFRASCVLPPPFDLATQGLDGATELSHEKP